MLIDTHAHLNFSDYMDLDEVIKRSLNVNVKKIICVSSNIEDSKRAIEIAKKYPNIVYAAVGIHPQDTSVESGLSRIRRDFQDFIDEDLRKLENLIIENKDYVVAVGECGLDFTEVGEGERKRSIEEQEKLFIGQIELALKYDLPILLHCNKAQENLYKILNNKLQISNNKQIPNYKFQNSKLKGVFHFYSGGKKRLKKFLEFENFIFGVDGPITYDEGLQSVVKEIPLNRIVLETDCPFLAPLPHRGERNEPAYIALIAQKVAEVKGVSLDELERQVEENVGEIFGI